MRKLVLTLAALAAFGIALPVVSNPADAREVIVIKKKRHYDRDRVVLRMRHRDDWSWRHRHRDHPHGAAVIVR